MEIRSYLFNENELANIEGRFGAEFAGRLPMLAELYIQKWQLSSLQLISSYSSNIVFICRSDKFGDAILKVGIPKHDTIRTESATLRIYNGRRLCRLFDADVDNHVLLEERIIPGTALRDESELDTRLSVFCKLYNGLHIIPDNEHNFPSYKDWVTRITSYMSGRPDRSELAIQMHKAMDICEAVSAHYTRPMLLHGDLHHDNILLGEAGSYTIIDPKGVVGDPVFDVPRFILNEYTDEITPELFNKINYILHYLEDRLKIPDSILRKCLFVETALGACWSVEDGADEEEYRKLIKQVAFAERILQEGI